MVLAHVMVTGFGAQASALGAMTFGWMQVQTISQGNSTILMVFVGLVAFSMLVVAAAVVGVAIGAMKARNELMGHVKEIKVKLLPLIDKSHGLVKDLTPEIKQITTQVHQISEKVNEITGKVNEITSVVKTKVEEVSPTVTQANKSFQDALGRAKTTFDNANDTVGDVNQKTRSQIDRVNGMVAEALDATTRMGRAIEHGITAPGRELAGMVAGAKATADSLLKHTSVLGEQIAGKVTGWFTRKPAQKRPAPAPSSPRGTNQTSSKVVAFGTMANASGSGTSGEITPGVSSGSGGNGDPIVG